MWHFLDSWPSVDRQVLFFFTLFHCILVSVIVLSLFLFIYKEKAWENKAYSQQWQNLYSIFACTCSFSQQWKVLQFVLGFEKYARLWLLQQNKCPKIHCLFGSNMGFSRWQLASCVSTRSYLPSHHIEGNNLASGTSCSYSDQVDHTMAHMNYISTRVWCLISGSGHVTRCCLWWF